MTVMRTVYLEFVGGTSAKAYEAYVTQEPSGFRVHATYGRIGSLTAVADKGTFPTYEAATDAFVRLVDSKTRKGYVVVRDVAAGAPEASAAYATPVERTVAVDLKLALLTPVRDGRHLEQLFTDDRYWSMWKYDGKRIAIDTRAPEPVAVNRNGIVTAVPQALLDGMQQWRPGSVADGELVGVAADGFTYVVFDWLFAEGDDVRSWSFEDRILSTPAALAPEGVVIASVASSEGAKRAMLAKAVAQRGEGLVFRDRAARYTAGRLPDTSANAWKHKLTAEVDAVVLKAPAEPGKASVEVGLFDPGRPDAFVSVGCVTVHRDMPAVGQIVRIRYLYAFPPGTLYQPHLMEVRTDKAIPDVLGSLKFVNKEVPE